jgi:ketosteroid isomerase-like protein
MVASASAVQGYFDALERGDAEKIGSMLTDDFVQDWPQSGERVRGREACLRIHANYPGGSPTMTVRRITGSGEIWVAESEAAYGTQPVKIVSILEFRNGLLAHQTDYFADPFEAPQWRMQWVERIG